MVQKNDGLPPLPKAIQMLQEGESEEEELSFQVERICSRNGNDRTITHCLCLGWWFDILYSLRTSSCTNYFSPRASKDQWREETVVLVRSHWFLKKNDVVRKYFVEEGGQIFFRFIRDEVCDDSGQNWQVGSLVDIATPVLNYWKLIQLWQVTRIYWRALSSWEASFFCSDSRIDIGTKTS